MDLILGSAQWGWTTDRQTAFQLLETWQQAGFRAIDGATNYPINKQREDFRRAEGILLEFIRAHQVTDLNITMKIGSVDNLRSPDHNLSPTFLMMMTEEYLRLFGENLSGIMVHWDNRTDPALISESLEALASLHERYGLQIGLSGIAHPEAYAQALQTYPMPLHIQVKHNIFQSDLARYKPLFQSQNHFFAYGINAGGVKLKAPYPAESTFMARGGNPAVWQEKLDALRALLPQWNIATVRPPVQRMNHLGMIYAGLNPMIKGLVLGTGNQAQLKETLDFYRNLDVFDYQDIWKALEKMS
ncbi:MAG: aldo/keto reductase [Lewinellaceae bacterium]|nr:aldo/keto reductase [Lewinellaceae bacterium]